MSTHEPIICIEKLLDELLVTYVLHSTTEKVEIVLPLSLSEDMYYVCARALRIFMGQVQLKVSYGTLQTP